MGLQHRKINQELTSECYGYILELWSLGSLKLVFLFSMSSTMRRLSVIEGDQG